MPSRRLVLAALVVGLSAGAVLTLLLVGRMLEWSWTPEVVQAGAAVASLLTTGVLAYLTWRYVQVTREIAGATRQQVADVVTAARRQQHAVAAALLQEVRRLQSELGAPMTGRDTLATVAHAVVHRDAEPPHIHDWFLPVIPLIAESDAAIVGLFLRLDHDLHNYGARVPVLHTAQDRLVFEQQTLADFQVTYPTPESEPEQLRQAIDAGIRAAQRHLESETQHVSDAYRACHATLDALETALAAVPG